MTVLNITSLQDRLDALEHRVNTLERTLGQVEAVAAHHLEQHDEDEYATVDLMQRSIETLATRIDRALIRMSDDLRAVASRANDRR